jgi:hypothetical protein
MFQRSSVASMSASRGELGKYVNRLGWAVSSEEQRLAVLGRLKDYAQGPNGNIELEKLITNIEAMTSLVQNPEDAIDSAVGASMKINLAATNKDMLMAYKLTRDAGFSDEAAQMALSNSLYSLMSEDNATDLHAIAGRAGLDIADFTNSSKVVDNSKLVNTILSRNDKFSEELIGLINIATENTGTALVSNTAKQMGMIRALQELYPEADFSGIGMVGFDDFATHLKLSGIVNTASEGDVNTVIDSIVKGANEVAEALGVDLPKGSIIQKIDNITRAVNASKDVKKVTGEEVKLKLLELFGLQDEAKENFGTANIDDIMTSVNNKLLLEQKRLGSLKYNQYVPFKTIADAFDSEKLNKAMDELSGVLTTRLGDAEGNLGKTLQDIVIENNLLRDIEDMPFNGYTLRSRSGITAKLIERNLMTEDELFELINSNSPRLFNEKKTTIVGMLRASDSFAQQEAKTTLQEFFTAHIQRHQSDQSKFNNAEEVMDKLLFEIEEMKNAARVLNPTIFDETNRMMGFAFENALSAAEPIEIAVPGMKPFTLQELSAFVRTNNELRLTNFFAKKQTDDMVNLIESLASKNADLDLTVPSNLMDKDFLSKLFKVDRISATNAEINMLERVPKLVNPEEVQQVLDGMIGSSIDLEFLEDFLAFNGEDLDPTGGIIGQRIRNAAVGKSEEEIAQEISNRVRLIGSIKRRYSAVLETQRPQYAQFNAMLEGGEEIAEGIITPGLRGEATERSLGTIDEAIENMMKKFIREADDETASALRASLARTYADRSSTASGKYTRIQDFMKSPQMRELYEGALKNKGKIAGVAAIATGLAIFGSINKKERTQEAMSGPPLLPGGNPYERIPNSPMGFSDAPISQNGQGMSYNISVDGDQDNIEQFMNRARISNKWECPRYYA